MRLFKWQKRNEINNRRSKCYEQQTRGFENTQKIGYQENKNIKLKSETSKLKTNQISEIKIELKRLSFQIVFKLVIKKKRN